MSIDGNGVSRERRALWATVRDAEGDIVELRERTVRIETRLDAHMAASEQRHHELVRAVERRHGGYQLAVSVDRKSIRPLVGLLALVGLAAGGAGTSYGPSLLALVRALLG